MMHLIAKVIRRRDLLPCIRILSRHMYKRRTRHHRILRPSKRAHMGRRWRSRNSRIQGQNW